MKKRTTTKEPVRGTDEDFRSALTRINKIANEFHIGKIKYVAYTEQMDAVIYASGWDREALYAEIKARKNKLTSR